MGILLVLFGFVIGWRFTVVFVNSWTAVDMSFSKPLGWWYHKVMCELSYVFFGLSSGYEYHLNVMVREFGINLYGVRIK